MPKLPEEIQSQLAALRETTGMSAAAAAAELRGLLAREAKRQFRRLIREGVEAVIQGRPLLPRVTDAQREQAEKAPEDYVRQRMAAVAPWALEARIKAAASGPVHERREAQQELLDRGGFGRRNDTNPMSALPAIVVKLENNPYLQQQPTVEGEVVQPELPEEFVK